MSTFAIKSHQYTITLYTPGHLKIIWELFSKKSADILSFHNSFILSLVYPVLSKEDKFKREEKLLLKKPKEIVKHPKKMCLQGIENFFFNIFSTVVCRNIWARSAIECMHAIYSHHSSGSVIDWHRLNCRHCIV